MLGVLRQALLAWCSGDAFLSAHLVLQRVAVSFYWCSGDAFLSVHLVNASCKQLLTSHTLLKNFVYGGASNVLSGSFGACKAPKALVKAPKALVVLSVQGSKGTRSLERARLQRHS